MQRPLPRQSRRRPRPLDPRHPHYWPTWAAIALAWLLARFPVAVCDLLGRLAGRLGWLLARRRRRIVETNLALCLPSIPDAQRSRLARRSFESAGIGALDSVRTWLGPIDPLLARMHIEGLDVLLEAQAAGRGVLLLGAHFTSMELAGALLTRSAPFDVVYRSSSNAAIDAVMWRGRRRYYDHVIVRTDVRGMLRALRAGRTLWYAADQDYGPRHSRFVPLFGQQAATITAAERLSRQTGAAVLAAANRRDRHGAISIHIQRIEPDMAAYNRWLETRIEAAPEQYLWLHRRFKTRPVGEVGVY